MEYHLILGILSGIFQTISVVPYIRSMLKGETRPNAVTWFVWWILQIIALFAQLSAGASWSVIFVAVQVFTISLILILVLKGYGYKKYEKIDYFYLILAITSLVLWQLTGEPVLAILLVVATDFFAILPTMLKTYKEPYSENLTAWILWILAALFAGLSSTKIDIANLALPIYYFVSDSIVVYLIYRGRGKKELGINNNE